MGGVDGGLGSEVAMQVHLHHTPLSTSPHTEPHVHAHAHTRTRTHTGRERHGWILDHVLAQGTDRRVVVRFRFSRRRVTRLRSSGEKHVEKRCGADSASERGVCRRRFERWQIVMGGHTHTHTHGNAEKENIERDSRTTVGLQRRV